MKGTTEHKADKRTCLKKSNVVVMVGTLVICIIIATSLGIHYSSKSKTNLRLPESLKPIHYNIKIRPFINERKNFRTNGHVDITFKAEEKTLKIILHMADIITLNETIRLVHNGTGENVKFKRHSYDSKKQFYTGTLKSKLKKDQIYILSMDYNGYLNDNLVGFYRSSYMKEEKEVLLAATHFEPTNARRAFPCFDEPALKATFNISIAREKKMGVISNMPDIETIPFEDEDGWYWVNFKETLPMSTYLVAFVVSDFVSLSSNENDHVLFRVWAREEALYQAEYALSIGPKVLTVYEEYFQIPFPLPKQDMIALPDFKAGAMENWGLITYRETALLFDPGLSGAANKQRVTTVVAHELAHQWFGDLVTPDWWTDIWLNEGFASYMEYFGSDSVEPTFDMLDQFLSDELHPSFETDSLENSHPIRIEVNNPDEIGELFDSISYSKGASLIRMMDFTLTEETFRAGISNYLKGMSYSSANQDDLWGYLTEQAHLDGTLDEDLTVKEIMDTWTLQMGYPVITVKRTGNDSAEVTQERFLLARSEDFSDSEDYSWWVPLTFTSEESLDFSHVEAKQWMRNDEKSTVVTGLPSRDKWIIFNVKQGGFYRVNYEVENWIALTNQLNTKHKVIACINRAQIIDDALDLSRAGLVHYNISLELNKYIKKEKELVPWYAVANNLGYLEEMFTRAAGYGSLKNYLLDLSTQLYEDVGFEDCLDDPHVLQLKRISVLNWSCNLQYRPCLESSSELYNKWMKHPDNNSLISPNLKSTVFCHGIAEGAEQEWNFAWEMYLDSNLGTDKDKLLSAMGCSKIPWILERYLELTFTQDSFVHKQDSAEFFNSIAKNDYGRDIAWNYLRREWYTIAEYYGSYTQLGEFVYVASSEFNTKGQLEEVKELRDKHIDELGTATQSVDQAIENVRINVMWMDNYRNVINNWLYENGYGDGIKIPDDELEKLNF